MVPQPVMALVLGIPTAALVTVCKAWVLVEQETENGSTVTVRVIVLQGHCRA